MVFSIVPMAFPMDFLGFPMVFFNDFLWFSQGISYGFLQGFLVVFPRVLVGFPMDVLWFSPWFSPGISYGFLQGFPMVFPWISSGVLQRIYGFPRNLHWFPLGFPRGVLWTSCLHLGLTHTPRHSVEPQQPLRWQVLAPRLNRSPLASCEAEKCLRALGKVSCLRGAYAELTRMQRFPGVSESSQMRTTCTQGNLAFEDCPKACPFEMRNSLL